MTNIETEIANTLNEIEELKTDTRAIVAKAKAINEKEEQGIFDRFVIANTPTLEIEEKNLTLTATTDDYLCVQSGCITMAVHKVTISKCDESWIYDLYNDENNRVGCFNIYGQEFNEQIESFIQGYVTSDEVLNDL